MERDKSDLSVICLLLNIAVTRLYRSRFFFFIRTFNDKASIDSYISDSLRAYLFFYLFFYFFIKQLLIWRLPLGDTIICCLIKANDTPGPPGVPNSGVVFEIGIFRTIFGCLCQTVFMFCVINHIHGIKRSLWKFGLHPLYESEENIEDPCTVFSV